MLVGEVLVLFNAEAVQLFLQLFLESCFLGYVSLELCDGDFLCVELARFFCFLCEDGVFVSCAFGTVFSGREKVEFVLVALGVVLVLLHV